MLGPVLRGEKLALEPPEVDDLPLFRMWFANLETTRTLLMRFVPSQAQEEEWYDRVARSENDVTWKLVVEGRAIGTTGIHQIDWINRHGSSGMLIGDPADWGKGYASEAVWLRTRYAFEELGLERLASESMAENVRMHRALEKSGYQKIGRARRLIYKGGCWHDAFLFDVLQDDWQALRANP